MIKNREKLIRVIQEDCKIRHSYYIEGYTCAIGGLAIAAGFDFELFFEQEFENDYDRQAANDTNILQDKVAVIALTIEEEFGLSLQQQMDIQELNDGGPDTWTRQEKIVRYINTLE